MSRTASRLIPFLLLLLGACAAEDGAVVDDDDGLLPPPAEGEGFQMAASTMVPAGTEVWECIVYELPNTQWVPVNRVESLQNDGMHHMNVATLAFSDVALEPGRYDCNELYEAHPDLMDAMIIYASQSEDQVIELPEGVVANLPPRLMVMHEIHYVNTSDAEVEAYSYVNAYAAAPGEITDTIWGGGVRDLHLNIPPNSKHEEWTRCVMNEPIDVVFLSSHTHALGKEVSVRLYDGETVGEEVYVNNDWHSPYLKSFADAPLHIPAGSGFEFTCKFDNPSDEMINYGFTAADEMCTMAMVFTPGEGRRKCEIVESSDGVLGEF